MHRSSPEIDVSPLLLVTQPLLNFTEYCGKSFFGMPTATEMPGRGRQSYWQWSYPVIGSVRQAGKRQLAAGGGGGRLSPPKARPKIWRQRTSA